MTATLALRVDVWLWRARLFRTRTLAATHVREQTVRLTRSGVTRRVDKPGLMVMAGDVVTFGLAGHIVSIEVLALGERRGPAIEARALYRPLETR